MKKILFPLFIAGIFGGALAQTPTVDFESWTGTGISIEPAGWVSGNALYAPPIYNNPQSVFQETTPANVHGGTSAMKIVAVKLVGNPSASSIPDPIGIAFPGSVTQIPLAIKNGFPYTSRIDKAEFYYMYAPAASTNDSAGCYLQLTKWNATTLKKDTIAKGRMVIKNAAATYVLGTVNLNYDAKFSTLLPDTMQLYFSATCYASLTCGKAGSTLWVDDIVFSGWNGVKEHPNSEGVILYPNPVASLLHIAIDGVEASKVTVCDVMGRVLVTSSFSSVNNGMNRKSCTIDTSTLAAGLYTYAIGNKEEGVLRSGTFQIVK